MSVKIHPKKPVSYVPGPTIPQNDPAKFPNKGKEHGKTMSGKTVIPQAVGPTFTADKTHIPDMHPSEYAKGKSEGQKRKSDFNPMESRVNLVEQRTASAKSGETTPSYPLKKEYRK